jgi:ATP adenylyltransferase
MKLLYAPWRNAYIKKNKDKFKCTSCVFCKIFAEQQDQENLVLVRLRHTAIIMNLYPYNAGHLLILPYQHSALLEELEPEIRNELIETVSTSMSVLTTFFKCDGMNMGLNTGKASGGSVPEHLHIHLVPRWTGDTNFLVAIADTKLISTNLKDLYDQLRPLLLKAFNQ